MEIRKYTYIIMKLFSLPILKVIDALNQQFLKLTCMLS